MDSIRNSATYASLKDLISLRGYAGKLDLNRKLAATARLSGNHHSRFRGRGMDYQESRTYQPGDDIRNMDWRVTARAGKPHTKLYEDERERPVFLLIDLSPQMFFASKGSLKSVIAAKTAALISWAAAARGDRIGAVLLNQDYHELRPKTGHHGVLQLLHALGEYADPISGLAKHTSGNSKLSGALQRIQRIARPGSQIFLISDFFSLNDKDSKTLMQLQQHNDLIAIQIRDSLEQIPPPAGQYMVTDGKQRAVIDTRSSQGHDNYSQFFAKQQKVLEGLFAQYSIPLLHLATTDNVATVIQASFGKRRARPHSSAGSNAA